MSALKRPAHRARFCAKQNRSGIGTPTFHPLTTHCIAGDCAGGWVGLGLEIGTAPGGGTDEMFCLRSCSTACSVARLCAICSCLAASCFRSPASCSTLRRTRARSSATGLSCCPNSGGASAEAANLTVGGSTQPSDGTQVLTTSFASSRKDCHASVMPTPRRSTKRKRARVRDIRLPIDGASLTN